MMDELIKHSIVCTKYQTLFTIWCKI